MKSIIRKETLKKRDEIPADLRAAKDALIKEKIFSLSEFRASKTILFYASFRTEAGTLDMIKESLNAGKKVVLPKVDKTKHRLSLYAIKDIVELSPGFMGIPEPPSSEERITPVDDLDLAVIPGAAFDFSGNRLGYGAGYYDILLAGKRKRIPLVALAYEEQIVDSIPAENHDVKMDIIVTDKRIIRN